jgi:hypothetical protein
MRAFTVRSARLPESYGAFVSPTRDSTHGPLVMARFVARYVDVTVWRHDPQSEVSRICGELDESLQAFRDRPLGHIEFPYVFLDATYVKARAGGPIVAKR